MKYEENDHFEIPEKYLKMSPEELKRAKEEKYERIKEKLEERFRTAINDRKIKVSSSEVAKGIFRSGEHHPFVEPAIEFFFMNVCQQCEDRLEDLVEPIVPSDTISSLKKRIKHCRNPLEKKNLERQLNGLYKERKKKHD